MRWAIERSPVVGVAIALLAVFVSGVNAYKNYLNLKEIQEEVSRSNEIKSRLSTVALLVLGSESGQRGYLLSAKPGYLKRYQIPTVSINQEFDKIMPLVVDPKKKELYVKTHKLILEKLKEIQATIDVSEKKGIRSAIAIVKTDKGEQLMNEILDNFQQLSNSEDDLLEEDGKKLEMQSRNTADTVALTSLIAFSCILWSIRLINKAIENQNVSQEEIRLKMETIIKEKTLTLQTQLEEFQSINNIKTEFGETLVHEFMNCLSIINGWTNVLLSENLLSSSQKVKEGIEVIQKNAKSLSILVNELLDMSRMARNKLHLERRPLDIVALVESTIQSQQALAQIKGIRIEISLCSNRAPISGDKERLQQIINNILSNAIKFTPSGGTVKVSVARSDTFVEISISDTGIGISSDFLPYVFDRFRQATNASRTYGGLGLGLTIAKQLIVLHGGTITAHSEGEGRGATFIVKLPASASYKSPSPQDVSPRLPSSLKTSSILAGLKIVVVDDYEDSRDMISFMLTMSGALVLRASSVSEALIQIEQHMPDLIISDIGLIVEDGFSLMQKVRSLSPDKGGNTPAIALSAHFSEQDSAQAFESGYSIHFAKSIISEDPQQLIVAIKNLSGRGRL